MTHYFSQNLSRNKYCETSLHAEIEEFPLYVSEQKAILIPKVWGEEELIHNKAHCVKKMTLKPGYQVSMHWHQRKEETFILISGGLIIETLTQEGELEITTLTEPLESFTLGINVPHTFYCPKEQEEKTVFLEASTPDRKDDSYRIFPSRKRDPDNYR